MQKGKLCRAIDLLSYAILCAGIATIALAAYLVVVSYSSLPHWDLWDTQIAFAAGERISTWQWLWKQEDQHRQILPKLFLLADLRWFNAGQASLLASIFGIQLAHLTALGWSMRRLGDWRGALWRTGVGLAAFCLFSPAQWENFVWGFQTSFLLPPLFATLAFVNLLLYWRRSADQSSNPWKYLVFSNVAVLGATYSLSNGHLLWLLLIATAVVLRLRIAAVLSFVITAVISTALYLHHYTSPPGVFDALRSPGSLTAYLSAYFGSAWISYPGIRNFPFDAATHHAAEIVGFAGLMIFIFLLSGLPQQLRDRRPFNIQLALTMLFCVGTGLLTSLGRLGFGVVQAFSAHYQSIALLFWCCLGLGLLARGFAKLSRDAVLLSVQAIVVCAMIQGAIFAETPILRARMRGYSLNAAAMALVTGVKDPSLLHAAYPPHPERVLQFAPVLRQQRLSAFSGPEPWWVGQPMDAVFKVTTPTNCAGEVEAAKVVDGDPQYSRITGWSAKANGNAPAEIIAVRDGVIEGLGATGGYHSSENPASGKSTSQFIGFTAYARQGANPSPVELYAVLQKREKLACYIATANP